jgi:hypothetical protein
MHKTISVIANIAFAMAVTVAAPAAAYGATAAPSRHANHHYVVVTAAMPKSMIDAALKHEAVAQPDEASPVSTRWQDYKDRLVVLRIEAQNKIYFKHNLSYTAVRVATQQPDSGQPDAGDAWEYLTTFLKVDPETGEVEDSVVVRTIADFRIVDGDPQGVVTSYCDGIQGACPSWVNETVS